MICKNCEFNGECEMQRISHITRHPVGLCRMFRVMDCNLEENRYD